MNANGLVLSVIGVWVITQVFAGDALRRLRIIGTQGAAPAPSAGSGGSHGGGNGGGGSW